MTKTYTRDLALGAWTFHDYHQRPGIAGLRPLFQMWKMACGQMGGVVAALLQVGLVDPATILDFGAPGGKWAAGRRVDRCRRIAFQNYAVMRRIRIQRGQ